MNYNIFTNPACMICKQKQDSVKLNKLKNLQRMLKGKKINIQPNKICRAKLRWYIQPSRCKYGLQCDVLRATDIYCQEIIDVITPLLVGVAEKDDESLYHMVMQQLRGNFPKIYKQMETLHAKQKMQRRLEEKEEKNENEEASSY